MPRHRAAGRRADGTCSATRWRTSTEYSPAHRNRKWSRRRRIRSRRNAETMAVRTRWCAPANRVSCCTRSTKTTVWRWILLFIIIEIVMFSMNIYAWYDACTAWKRELCVCNTYNLYNVLMIEMILFSSLYTRDMNNHKFCYVWDGNRNGIINNPFASQRVDINVIYLYVYERLLWNFINYMVYGISCHLTQSQWWKIQYIFMLISLHFKIRYDN